MLTIQSGIIMSTASQDAAVTVNKPIYEQIVFERRILLGCTCLIGTCVLIWIMSISTDHWAYVEGGQGIYIPSSGRYFIQSNTGLWRLCREVLVPVPTPTTTTEALLRMENVVGIDDISNETSIVNSNETDIFGMDFEEFNHTIIDDDDDDDVDDGEEARTKRFTSKIPQQTAIRRRICKNHDMFPTDERIRIDPSVDKGILNYSRTEVSFAIISLGLMIMGFMFSLYTFRNPRYTFKRLAGGIHFITGSTVLVVIEVFLSSLDYERAHLVFNHPQGATLSYGFSIYLAWLVFASHVFAGCCFMIYSRKRKGNKAPNEEMGMVDEPTIIGR